MKKILCLICLMALLFPTGAFAQQVSEEQAREKAKEFFQNKANRNSTNSSRKVMAQRNESTFTLASKDSMYYVFNVGESQGFVIVSGDERTIPVLGYSSTGTYSKDNLPEGLKMLMESYKQQLKSLEYVDGLENLPKYSPRTERHAIEPLLDTMWDQSEPFNRFTPNNAPTGCVATAMAQIMNYHQWPAEPTKTIPSYEMYSSGWGMTEPLEPVTFDWQNIHSLKNAGHYEPLWNWSEEKYDYNILFYTPDEFSESEATAVSTLMKYCGHAVEMQYTDAASSATTEATTTALTEYFDYDAEYLLRNNVTNEFWDEILYNEISHNRPVFYSGAVNDFGSNGSSLLGMADASHAFVCDGYDGDGMFHFNFGWSGGYDGYYASNIINSYVLQYSSEYGYNFFQDIVCGIRPHGTMLDADDLLVQLLDEAKNLDIAPSEAIVVDNVKFKSNHRYASERPWFGWGMISTSQDFTITLTNTSDKPFASTVDGIMDMEVEEGEAPFTFHYYQQVSLQPGESRDYDFHYNVKFDHKQPIVLNSWNGYIATIEPLFAWTSSDSGICLSPGDVIPDDVLAIDLRRYDASQFLPSNNPNTIYYLDGNVPEVFRGKNVVVDGKATEINLATTQAMSAPIEFTADKVKLDIQLPVGEWVPFSAPFTFKVPDGVKVMEYNYNVADSLFFMNKNEINEFALCLVNTNVGEFQVSAENVKISTNVYYRRGADYNSIVNTDFTHIDRGYLYDSAVNTFNYVENQNITSWSGYFINQPYGNEGNYDVKELKVAIDDVDVVDKATIYTEVRLLDSLGNEVNQITLPRNYDGNDIIISRNIGADKDLGLTFTDFAYGYYDGTDLVHSLESYDKVYDYMTGCGVRYDSARFPADIANGEYQLKVGYKFANAQKWNLKYSDFCCIDAVFTDTEVTLSMHYDGDATGNPRLRIEDIDFGNLYYERESLGDSFVIPEVRARATNPSDLNLFEVSYQIRDDETIVNAGVVDGKKYLIGTNGTEWVTLKNLHIGKGLADGYYVFNLNSRIYNTADWVDLEDPTGLKGSWYLHIIGNELYIENCDAGLLKKYTLTYKVDGEVYHTEQHRRDEVITPLNEPTKEGYTFSGWSEIPATMPAHDVEVNGSFTINKYTIKFVNEDGSVLQSNEVEYGVTPVYSGATPTKTSIAEYSYTFAGWTPEIVAATADATYTATYTSTPNQYKLTYKVDGEVYKENTLNYGEAIIPEAEPTKEGYTFSGWSEIPATMPAHDVEVNGSFEVNYYDVLYFVGDELVHEDEVAYGDTFELWTYDPEDEDLTFNGWIGETYETMPAHDISYKADITSGIAYIINNPENVLGIYTIDGKKVEMIHQGVYVIRMKDGSTRKFIAK